MAITPGSRGRETRTDFTDEERDTLNPMQEPLGSMDRPGRRARDDVNAAPGEAVRSTATRRGRTFTTTLAIAAAILLAAFLVTLYIGSNRSKLATGTGGTQAPIADSTTGSATGGDATGSTTVPTQKTAPGTGDVGGSNSGTTTLPANP